MKKIILFLLVASFFIFIACTPEAPTQEKDDIDEGTLILSTFVTVGNSLTAGFQSSGLAQSFQENSYPYLIAQQMGKASTFQQPLVAAPGVGSPSGFAPQQFNPTTGAITQDPLTAAPVFPNLTLSRSYNNLGIPGFDLNDAMNTLNGGMADFILRNPTFGNINQIDQALGLSPTLLILWLGNNDVLGAALDGGDLTQITSAADFQTRLTDVLTRIRVTWGYDKGLVMANVPNVTDIPYINMLDIIFRDLGAGPVPVLFDATFQPIDLGGGMMLPIITEETGVVHVTLPGAIAYQSGLGIPDSAYIVDNLGFPPGMAAAVVAGLMAQGVTPTGLPIPGSMTITTTEEAAILAATVGFNTIIDQLAAAFVAPVLDANQLLSDLNAGSIPGISGSFVYVDPLTTAFSLDGVHPNNAGYAFIANAFISLINGAFGQSIPALDYTQYTGQYTGANPKMPNLKAVEGVRELFRNK